MVCCRIWLDEALMDCAKIPTNATSPSPIINAAAVDAVRFGLRMAFSRPSLPDTPHRRSGQPSTRATGRTINGLRTATPKNTVAAPRPANDAALEPPPRSPVRRMPMPAARMTSPVTRRRVEPAYDVGWASRLAAMGGERDARSAGTTEDKTVAPRPTTAAATTVLHT